MPSKDRIVEEVHLVRDAIAREGSLDSALTTEEVRAESRPS